MTHMKSAKTSLLILFFTTSVLILFSRKFKQSCENVTGCNSKTAVNDIALLSHFWSKPYTDLRYEAYKNSLIKISDL